MHRQQALEEIMEHHDCTKETAKESIIRIYNGGSFKQWIKDNNIKQNKIEPAPFLEDLQQEIKGMRDHMLALPKYNAIKKSVYQNEG